MKKGKIISIAVLAVIFAVTAFLGFSGMLSGIEDNLSELINPQRKVSVFFKFFTNIGEAAGVIGITAFFMLVPVTRRRVGAPLSVTVVVSWIVSNIIKRTVKRARPLERLIEVGGYSFPSGHAMNNAALYIGLMLLLLKICKTRIQKTIVITVCLFFTLAIGISRIYFNVHYLSDVICGWCLGSIVALLFSDVSFIKRKRKRVEK